MSITIFTATGTKKGTMDLPSVFTGRINRALMHQALVVQQSNRRTNIAHVKNRGEVAGSTKKLFQQKGTGRARRGPVRSPLLRGGGKTFGPRNDRNFIKDMPKSMRRAAIASCLAWQAKREKIIGLENYGDSMKTKTFVDLLKKLPVEIGRRIVVVLPDHHKGLEMSARNVKRVKTLTCNYLNVEDLTGAHYLIFLTEAIDKIQEILGRGKDSDPSSPSGYDEAGDSEESDDAPKKTKKTAISKAKAKSKPKKLITNNQ